MFRSIQTYFLLLPLVFLSACSKDETPSGPQTTQPDSALVSGILRHLAENVVTATYTDLAQQAAALARAVADLRAAPSEATLTSARAAWRATRRPWEQSEGFLFGPVDSKGYDPRLDSWPVNRIDLDAVLAGGTPLTKEYIDQLENTQRGFHTIEYLLFGAGGDSVKTAAHLTTRELDYADAAARSLSETAELLRAAWAPDGDHYARHISEAGRAGNVYYASRQAALQEFVNGMIAICDEVATGKINDPYSQRNRTLEESQFSDNSNADFTDNIISVRNLFAGTYGNNSGPGIATYVDAVAPALRTRITREIDAAITAIQAMTPTFGRAIFQNPSAVEAAMAAVLALRVTLESELIPLVATVR